MSYKQLINFDNYYIYDDGKVYSIKSKIFLKPTYNNEKYLRITLIDNNKKRKTFMVHRLVYEVFNEEIPEGLQVDHINGIRDDNRLINLRLFTNKENSQNRHHLDIYKECDKQRSLKENKEKRKEYKKKYYEEHKEEIKKQRQIYYQENKERRQKYYEEHKDEINRKRREKYYNNKFK